MTKKEKMYQNITKHGQNIISLFSLPADTDPVKLSKQLFRIENRAHCAAERWCNGEIEADDYQEIKGQVLSAVNKLLDNDGTVPVFVNSDPRGYSLKIRDDYIRDNNIRIYRDWGGYGIIAPDFND